ncbi:hypothetical protein SNE40_002808 [Patella caerulea]|uniref:Uncharacterized protein n=1 Tax=Patella caerulea TaxID=87958 RepID=A0AAN8Q449_PATCE
MGDTEFQPRSVFKNLGVLLDSGLTFTKQVDDLCRKCYCHLKNISSIRHVLTQDSASALARSLILSRLDYCNSLFTGLPQNQLNRFQRIQNITARMVTRSPYHCHITPVLQALHWLPVSARIDFKVLCLTYQCVSGEAPDYLFNLIQQYIPKRHLRSYNFNQLVVPKGKLASFGQRAFAVAAAEKWNSLPVELRFVTTLPIFKSRLKTHLFKIHNRN